MRKSRGHVVGSSAVSLLTTLARTILNAVSRLHHDMTELLGRTEPCFTSAARLIEYGPDVTSTWSSDSGAFMSCHRHNLVQENVNRNYTYQTCKKKYFCSQAPSYVAP